MIGSLRGELLDRSTGELQVEVGGIGYRVVASPTTAMTVGEVGGEVFVWVHHHVREDAETLYGFATRDERTAFEALLGAHGVGPSLALAILSVHGPEALVQAVQQEDTAALCLVPGVGKKTAARLLIELKSRFDALDLDVPGLTTTATAPGEATAGAVPAAAVSAHDDVRAALVELGYGPEEVKAAMATLPADGDAADTGVLLRQALAVLARRSVS
jgi:holliday junction DNA helicase RuvA